MNIWNISPNDTLTYNTTIEETRFAKAVPFIVPFSLSDHSDFKVTFPKYTSESSQGYYGSTYFGLVSQNKIKEIEAQVSKK